ncbi:hypothetical protein [Virgisporangium aurantiacum]|uniref:hypothetical protein n=1 Tax=Virgisporangium aurantiacum TaxID=175570 RepID=UPI00194EA07E|nr:hypothetical protein [Virgisporangium aurantiacum]
MAIAGEVWQALQAAGAGVPNGDGLSALGFPAPDAATTARIDTQATRVDLAGGLLGRGHLARDATSNDWRWEPEPRFDITMSHASGYWTADRAAQQLRIRALAVLPRADARELQITPTRRRDLEQALPVSEFVAQISALCQSRGAALTPAHWVRGPNRNALDAFSYSSRITKPGDQVALSAEVMTALPNAMNSSVVTCAELRIENLPAWTNALTAAAATAATDMRLSIYELIDLLMVAWQTATETLCAVVAGTERQTIWVAPPTVELHVSAERRFDQNGAGGAPTLDTYIDLSPLGRSDRGSLSTMSVTVTAPPRLDRSARQALIRQAVLYMAQQFGFVDVTEDVLQPARSSSR